ncbi:MAG: CPBP family intramembrane metalloprotease [Bacteroidales bacterium]|nr:CPBP family intramembrane metalloprotease [Candidatus Scybalousia scybalohippi]
MLFNKDSKPLVKCLGLLAIMVMVFIAIIAFNVLFGLNIDTSSTSSLLIIQGITTIGMFALPMFIYNIIFEDKSLNIKTFNQKSPVKDFIIAIVLILLSNFLISLFSTPDANNEFIEKCLENKNLSNYFVMMIVIALTPAICEEWFFRAGLQKIFISWSRNAWVGIILASCIFSIFHGDFANFIPRAVLGFVLGILYHYSNNIWVNISAHFFNNGLIVTAYFFNIKFLLEENNENPTLSSYLLAGLALLAIVAFIYYNEAKRKQKTIEK